MTRSFILGSLIGRWGWGRQTIVVFLEFLYPYKRTTSYSPTGAYLLHTRSTDQASKYILVSPPTGTTFPSADTFNSLRVVLTFTWPFSKICSSHICLHDSGE